MMIKSQRKRHWQVWLLLSLLLPAGILLSWLAIPNQVPVRLLKQDRGELLPTLQQSVDLDDYCVRLRSNPGATAWQLEWKNKSILSVPSAVIYQVSDTVSGIEKADLVGRIETADTYLFPLTHVSDPAKLKFLLFDFIHEKKLAYIHFQK